MASLIVKAIRNNSQARIAKNRETFDPLTPHRSHQDIRSIIFSHQFHLQQKETPSPHSHPHIWLTNVIKRLRVRLSMAFSRHKNLILSIKQSSYRIVDLLGRIITAEWYALFDVGSISCESIRKMKRYLRQEVSMFNKNQIKVGTVALELRYMDK